MHPDLRCKTFSRIVYTRQVFSPTELSTLLARLDVIDATIPTGAEQRFLAKLIMCFDVSIAEMINNERRGNTVDGLRASGFTAIAEALDASTP